MNRLAESVIEEVLAGAVSERQDIVDQALTALQIARRELVTADRDLSAWQRSRRLDYTTAMKALQAAKFADFVTSAVPPGTYPKAVTDYLKAHPPVWNVPGGTVAPLDKLRRVPRAAIATVRRALPTPRRQTPR